jgi:hypothetical protein
MERSASPSPSVVAAPCRTAEEGHAGRRFSLEGHATFGAFPFLMTGSFSSSDEEEEEL